MSTKIFKLTLLAFFCALALSLFNAFSHKKIVSNKAAFELHQLQSVLGNKAVTLQMESMLRYAIYEDEKLIGHLVKISTNDGYNGYLSLWLGISLTKKVLGARIIKHSETPGLGDKLDINISPWILSFNNQSLTSVIWKVKKDGGDFDQFSGATITPRAVIAAIHHALEIYEPSTNQPKVAQLRPLTEGRPK